MPVVIQACFSEDSFFCLARDTVFLPSYQELARQDPRWLLLLIINRGGGRAEMLS